ncbi:MAG TPA: DUF1501 domain-containing protein, partial [Armatimonadota bacterium]|nr:DUF1501 domain-containing protein [Armatimonadota bacterium]
MHCNNFAKAPLSRRELLLKTANGMGAVALTALLEESAFAAGAPAVDARKTNPLAPRKPHHPAKAKNVIFLFMDGGPSQVDTFDPKPRLVKEHGEPIKIKVPATQ